MQKPFHTWTRFFQQLGLRPRSRTTATPIGSKKPRTLMVEQLTPRHLLTVDVLGDGVFAEFDDAEAVQEVSIVSTEPGSDHADRSGDSRGDCCMQNAAFAGAVSSPWQNPDHPLDVDGDGNVTARDALLVANQLNARGTGPLEARPLESVVAQAVGSGGEGVLYVDTNGDGQLTSEDFEAIVVYLNAPGPVGVSSVSSEATGSEPSPQPAQEKLGSSPRVEGDFSSDSGPQAERFATGAAEEGAGDGAQDGSAEPEFSMMSSYGSSGSGGGDASGSGDGDGCIAVPRANTLVYRSIHRRQV